MATSPKFILLADGISEAKSVQAQVNTIARVLYLDGYDAQKALHPECHETAIDGSKYLVYVWRDTPFGDHLVLTTGPSFVPKVALAGQIPAEPGVGVYVRAVLTKGKVQPTQRSIDTAKRQQDRTRTAEDSGTAKRHAREAEAAKREQEAQRKAQEAQRKADADREAAHERERQEAAHRARAAEAEQRRAEAERRRAEEEARARTVETKPAFDAGKAAEQAQALIAALKSMKK